MALRNHELHARNDDSRLAGDIEFSTVLSIRPLPSVTLKTNEPILMQSGTGGPHCKGMKWSTLGLIGQRSRSQEAKMGQTWEHNSCKMAELILLQSGTSGRRGRTMKQSTWGSVCQRSRSQEVKVHFGGSIESSLSRAFDQLS